MATTYRIYPPIGIARVGNSPEFFIGPESPGSLGTETQGGAEVPSQSHKDSSFRVKRQAARFQIFEFNDDAPDGRPFVPPDGVTVTWSVSLANLKDAVQRPGGPPSQPIRPVIAQGRENRAIRASDNVTGPGASSAPMVGKYLENVANLEEEVTLGQLQTDAVQRLIVLGGSGRSESPEGAAIGSEMGGGGFYNNPKWFDDVSDGPITAEIAFPSGTETAAPAWVVVAPPDFAPDSHGVVTLYDVLVELSEDEDFQMLAPFKRLSADTVFTRDIQPLVERSRSLRWVNGLAAWDQISDDMQRLGNNAASEASFRQQQRALLERVEHVFFGLSRFHLMDWQKVRLQKWGNGAFERNLPANTPTVPDVVLLTRSVLDATIGQGFFPGIEAGRILLDKDLYSQPFDFRLSHAVAEPGWLTALMALPWQADFIECNGNWWPSQRPDLARQPDGSQPRWARPLDEDEDHRKMVQHSMKFGMIFPEGGTPGNAPVEVGRDDQGIPTS